MVGVCVGPFWRSWLSSADLIARGGCRGEGGHRRAQCALWTVLLVKTWTSAPSVVAVVAVFAVVAVRVRVRVRVKAGVRVKAVRGQA